MTRSGNNKVLVTDGMECQVQKYLNTISAVCLSLVSNNKHFTSKENYV